MPGSIARLMSLDLLRGFVAVGRRMSITLAAEDLCITQSAASRQIRTLEDMLGVKLLIRGHRSIAFTAEGDRLFRTANAAIQQLQDAIGSVRVSNVRQPVTITCTIGVAGLWLLPRLRDFQCEHPGIDVRISATDRVEDLRGDGIDLAIRYCSQTTASEGAERLFGESVAPVVHPGLGLATLDSPQALAPHCLLEFDGPNFPWLQWHEWLTSQGWGSVKSKSTLRFNQYDQVISAALAGQGIALGRLELLGPMLREKRLQVLAGPKAGPTTTYGYWLISARPKPRPDVATIARWIRCQAAASCAAP
ncbi:MAG TPA: LysR substrate-binding domain-containing protein [Acetobacteraceae bacterium]|nr:LysR substrate-binding domain-containing protein [Acetobacteraceae bacterium]